MQQVHAVGKRQGVSTLKQMMRIVTTFNGNGKGKVIPVQAIKAHTGSRGIVPRILNLGISRKWVTSVVGHITPGKRAACTH
jgi:hypothetical protein